MAYKIHKIAGVMHAIVVANGPWRRNVHGSRATGLFVRVQEAENSELNGQKGDKSEQKRQKRPLLKPLRVQKRHMFDWKC